MSPKTRTVDHRWTPVQRIASIMVAVFAGFVFWATDQARAQNLPWETGKKTVVLDPGHGGHDIGALGTDGTEEKAVTLALAKILAGELKGACRLVLSRTDDYFIDIPERTAAANHEKADLFVSLHTGGSFTHTVNAVQIFYFDPLSIPDLKPGTDAGGLQKGAEGEGSWRRIQLRHTQRSKKAADALQHHLGTPDTPDVRVAGAPLLVLEGADMPAVLIEIGHLTHPAEERRLTDMDLLTGLAKRIGMGILTFLEAKPTDLPIDLNPD